jgi:hypothetical protein
LQKPFQFIFLFVYKITKMKIKSFECPKEAAQPTVGALECHKSIRNYEKKILGTPNVPCAKWLFFYK